MNTTIEKIKKIDKINISESKIQKTKEDEKRLSSKDQFCLKALDYFVF